MKPRAARQHNPRACRLPRRPPIRHKFFLRCAVKIRTFLTFGTLEIRGNRTTLQEAFPELARLIDHEKRATRSDLLEGLGLVLWCLLARMDLRSFRIGHRRRFYVDGRRFDFAGLPRETLARWCALSERTISRACTLLRRAGLVHGPAWSKARGGDGANVIPQPIDENDDGSLKGLPAIRRFSPLFFAAIGEGESLAELRAPRKRRPPPAAPSSGGGVAVGPLVRELVRSLALERPPDG